jgi:hypothetical protein
MVEELKEIETALEEILKELNSQQGALVSDGVAFHTNLINLLSTYPEEKELIHFIVFINDRLETSQTLSKNILFEAVCKIIVQKQYLVKRMIKEKEKEDAAALKASWLGTLSTFLKDNKILLMFVFGSIAVAGVSLSIFISPTETVEVFKSIEGLRKVPK